MRMRRLLFILVVMTLLGASVGVVQAAPLAGRMLQEEAEEIEVTGTVVSIDEENGTLVVEVEEDGETVLYTVEMPEDFDFDEIEVGSLVEVEGVTDADGNIVADKVKDETEDDDDDDEDEAIEDGENFFCANPDILHPVGDRLAEHYDTAYEQVMAWFCEDGMGFGQIMLALRTAEMMGESGETYLERRADGEGWGQIWQSLNLIGPGRDKDGGPEDAGPPDHAGGPPEHAGPPEDVGGPPEHAGGPPEHAGPPDHAKGRGRSD